MTDNAIPGTIVTRILSSDDFKAFWALRLHALQESPRSFGASFEESSVMPESEAITRLSPAEGSFVLAALRLTNGQEKMIGLVGFQRWPGLKTRHKGLMWGVYVLPEERGHGVARRMMMETLERCQTIADLEDVNLSVSTTNPSARALYASLGFEPYGLERRALKVNGEYCDEELMTKTLA